MTDEWFVLLITNHSSVKLYIVMIDNITNHSYVTLYIVMIDNITNH
jgi:hypothetical protein